jgi:anhydro-N-acetylmuramic acid kinase
VVGTPLRVVGLMSGTSHDAIEVAAADFSLGSEPDGGMTVTAELLGARTVGLDPELRAAIVDILPPAVPISPQGVAAAVCRLDTLLGQAFAAAAELACRELCGGRADLVVSHGQTIYHWVEGGRALGTLQLGAPAWIAERAGAPVVSDLRSRDITRGGQGAPLVSLFDALLLPPAGAPRAALNLGGIANLTVIPPARGAAGTDAGVVAFDVGPANALIDAAVATLSGGTETMDTDGRHARRGRVLPAVLEDLLSDPYYRLPPPKSTGKEHFNAAYLAGVTQRHPETGAGDDLVATLTELTAVTVADGCAAAGVTELVVSGGGTRNPALMDAITRHLTGRVQQEGRSGVAVRTIDELGIPSHAKEALAFALLGYLTVHGLPGTAPTATGARSPSVLGSITPGNHPLRLPEPVATPPRRLRVIPVTAT